MKLFLILCLLLPLLVYAQNSIPPNTSPPQIQPVQPVQELPEQQAIQPRSQPHIPALAPVRPLQAIQQPQGDVPSQATQPTMPANTLSAAQTGATQAQAMPPPQHPTMPQQPMQPAIPKPPPAPQPLEVASLATTGASKLPSDFEFIAISPYYKNKPRLGKLTATVTSLTNEVLGTVSGDFGDCKNCIRGASIKGKLGVRLYGQSLKALMVSRKQSSSIQIEACPTNILVVGDLYTCDFVSGETKMKMNLRIEP